MNRHIFNNRRAWLFGWKRVGSVAAVLSAVACGGGPTSPGGSGDVGGSSTVTATIDGQPFQSAQVYAFVSSTDGRGWLNVAAVDGCGSTSTSIGLLAYKLESPVVTVGGYSATRSLMVQVGPGAFSTYREFTGSIAQGIQNWSSGNSGGSGTMTITALSSTQVEGTFSFVATVFGGASASRSASGSFRAPIRDVRIC